MAPRERVGFPLPCFRRGVYEVNELELNLDKHNRQLEKRAYTITI